MGITLAGFGMYQAALLFPVTRQSAVLGGIWYVSLPYLLVNMHARGAFTEAFAQMVLPWIIYLVLKLRSSRSPILICILALLWAILATSHLITLLYGGIFVGLLVVLLFAFGEMTLQSIALCAMSLILGVGVASFQLVPILEGHDLRIMGQLGNPFVSNWLTPLSGLLSLGSTPPEPTGGLNTPFLHANIGLPLLTGVVGCLYFLFLDSKLLDAATRRRIGCLLIVFCVAFFCAWSPVDFWRLLPQQFSVAQFSYRFLTYVGLMGVLLSCIFADAISRKLGPSTWLILLVLALLTTGQYLPAMPRGRTVDEVIAVPDLGYGAAAYLFRPPSGIELVGQQMESQLPLVYSDGWLMLGQQITLPRRYLEGFKGYLYFKGATVSPLAKDCHALTLAGDGIHTQTFTIPNPGPFELKVPASDLLAPSGPSLATLRFESACGFVPHVVDPKSTDPRLLWISVNELRFVAPEGARQSLAEVRPHCSLAGSEVVCHLRTTSPTEVQLPVLYYPRMLRVSINSAPQPYIESAYKDFSLASVKTVAGDNVIVVAFSGDTLGNNISWFSIILIGGVLFSVAFRKKGLQLPHAGKQRASR